MRDKVIQYIDGIVAEKKIPYLDVIMYQEHKEVFRYYTGIDKDITGKEQLILYSASKPVTAIATMIAVEEGKLNLEDKVSKYLPEFESVFTLDENGNKVKPKTDMTIRHLMTMSAGFNYVTEVESVKRVMKETGGKATTRQIIDALIENPLLFNPGERFEYSLCLDVIVPVVEVAVGMNFNDYAREKIFKPLKMEHTSYSNKQIQVKDCYKTYICTEDKNIIPQVITDDIFNTDINYISGGAGLKSTVCDYIKFADCLANGGVSADGKKIIKEETLSLVNKIKREDVVIQKNFTCIQGKEYGYGLGVRVRKEDTPWGLKKGEYGWDGAYGSYVMVDPDKKISVFMGMNIGAWPYVFREHLGIVQKLYEEIL